MGRGGELNLERNIKKRIRSKGTSSDGSDEDFILGEDEEFDDSEGSYASCAGDSLEERFDEGEERSVVRSRVKTGNSGRRESRVVKRAHKKIRVSDDEEEEDCYFDEDDEEFMPDGIDCVDEEEELLVKKKSKVKKRVSCKKLLIKSQKRKRKSKVSKKPLKKKQRRRLLERSAASSDDEFIIDNMVIWEDKKKPTRSGRGKKRLVVHSDSDFVSSGHSDHEYTISEEERESLREASNFCGNLTTCLRSSSLSKSLQVDGASNCQQRKPAGRKGKEKVEDLLNALVMQVCGICLSEEGKGTIRGTLNCCSHYFCFACIMQWSKVESRCPLCKQRFETISKPARSNIGIDLRNMVIQVPKREQVYQPSEEEMRGYLDPYENVVCMECKHGGDDNLMLLCDICDSPAHTYCVGLGKEVPEGNWYCEGCRASDPGSYSQIQDPVPNQGTSNINVPSELSTVGINVEDFDKTTQYLVSTPDPSFCQGIGILPSPRCPVVEDVRVASPSGAGASTLSGRRRTLRQILNLLSSNRMSQVVEMVARTNGISHGNVEGEVVESEVEQGAETIIQLAGTLVSSELHSVVVEGFAQDANSCTVQDKDPVSAGLSHLRRQVTQSPGASIANSSASGNLFAELEQINPILGYEQEQSKPVIGSDDSISRHMYGEESHLHAEGAKGASAAYGEKPFETLIQRYYRSPCFQG